MVFFNRPADAATRGLFRASVCLAIAFLTIKACYLGLPWTNARSLNHSYFAALAAITYIDIVFVAVSWLIARLMLSLVARWRLAAHALTIAFVSFAALSCVYVVGNVVMLNSFGGFVTFQLLALVGDLRMLRSSVTAYLTPAVVAGLVCVPLTYLSLVWAAMRVVPARLSWGTESERGIGRLPALAALLVCGWIALGAQVYGARWATRQDRAIAENPHWVFLSSWWRAAHGVATAGFADRFDPSDLLDFAPLASLERPVVHEVSTVLRPPPRPPLSVILIVLESVAARWTSLHGKYATTPALVAESKHALVFDNFYAHIGRSSNSLASMLLSTYPKLDFRDITDAYPNLPGTSIAARFRERGYRTTFVTPSDLSWAGWSNFLKGRGFDAVEDLHQLTCTAPLSSWGVEDRCMVDRIIDLVTHASQPFFVMGWTQQTHHPYEPTPDVPMLDLVLEHGIDDYDLNRYLNVLRETDRHLGRLFDAIRRSGRADDTMVVVVGDHGQAFGVPHAGDFAQGRTVYEEDVHVPLMIWSPRLKAAGTRSTTLGGHVDLAPTIAGLAGVASAADWYGRSLLDPDHPPRAYFYVAEDYFRLGVRERNWKYVYDLREAVEELYDLDRDPTEQHNLAAYEPQRSARLRQRLAAWTEANRRQYHR